MFNLLPENLKDTIRKEYKFRKIIVILLFIISLQISFLIFIFPTWLISLYNEKEVLAESENVKKQLSDLNISPATLTIKSLNTKLNIINTTLEYPKILPLFNTIISKKTNSIQIDEFLYTLVQNNTAEIIIGGTSLTRESLVSFVKSLEDTKSFKQVNLPISNLAKDRNINFSISMKITTE